ncbi:UNVERIFIED_CONTAM: hypothetical protein GTU68_001642 [Idotea baltica]|nr:hypothetical protein [Idotea baltica]
MSIERIVSRAWYGDQAWVKLLSPLSKIYKREHDKRKAQAIESRRSAFVAPVVVVGNITVGGTGKTPLIVYLACALRDRGVQVGIISRGYGGNPPSAPYLVNIGDRPEICGDEPLMIAEATGVPVVVDKDRCAAAEHLIRLGTTMILSDDGLQHYALPRKYEIAVIDGERGLGNGLLLPARVARACKRLESVDCFCTTGLILG